MAKLLSIVLCYLLSPFLFRGYCELLKMGYYYTIKDIEYTNLLCFLSTIIYYREMQSFRQVKPFGSRGPHAVAAEVYQGVVLYTQWSPWSECSVCGKVGRRHRHGICYVKLEKDLVSIRYQPVFEWALIGNETRWM